MNIPENVRQFLAPTRFGVLATINADGTAQLTTMWYEVRGDDIIMNTKVGRLKERNLRRDPRISVCVADGYNFVTLTGRAQLNDDQAVAQDDIRRLAIRYHGEEQGNRQSKEQFAHERRVTIVMPVERLLEYNI